MAFSETFDKTFQNFVRALIAGVSIHIFASHSFDFLEKAAHGEITLPEQWPVLAASAAIAGVFALWLKHSDALKSPWPWLAVGGFLLFQWIAAAIHHMVPEGHEPHLDPLLVLIALALAGILWWIYQWALEGDTALHSHPEPVAPADPSLGGKNLVLTKMTKANSLILFLSPLKGFPLENLPKGTVIDHPLDPAVFRNPATLAAELPAAMGFHDLKSLDPLKASTWYMPLKAIETHVSLYPDTRNLEIVLIPSADSERFPSGTWRQAEAFAQLVQRLAAPGRHLVQVTVLEKFRHGVHYEDLSALSEAVRLAKSHIKAKDKEGLIVVDITSGQGTCSAVGGALSLEHRERIQYVSTTDWAVTLYDLRYEPLRLPME